MASKAKTRATSSQGSTPVPQVPTSTSSVRSPMTPTRLSRIQEKDALVGLNDRLAAYIERNQQLEQENQFYSKQVTTFEETLSKQVTRIKGDYEKEVANLRRIVDETAKDKSKLERDFTALKSESDDTKSKFDKKNKEFNDVQKNLAKVEDSLAQLQNTNSRVTAERDKLQADNKDLQGEVTRLAREVGDLKKKLEQEVAARDEAERKWHNKDEEIQFQNQMHQQEISEMRSRRQIEIQEIDKRAQQDYEVKLQEAIQELRAEHDAQLMANKDEMENIYEQKVTDMKNQLKRAKDSLNAKLEELTSLQIKLDASSANMGKYEQERNDLLRRIKELEKKSDDDHSRFAKMLDSRDSEIDNLMKEKTTLLNEYQDLMDTKVALDNEIATYRKLLETEEKRLSISPRMAKRGLTPIGERRATPLRAAKKRRFEESMAEEAQFESDTTCSGDIMIEEDHPDGRFIRLVNKGDKEVSLSGWTLTRKSGELETTHKFHRQIKVNPGETVTVWSADAAGALHEPPHHITMKQKWFPSETMFTTLHNNTHEQMASRNTRRSQSMLQRRRLGFGFGSSPEDLFHQEGEGQGDRCAIC